MKISLKVTDWINGFNSKTGKVGTLLILEGKNTSGAEIELSDGKKVAKDEIFETVSWQNNPEFKPETRFATLDTESKRVSLQKLTSIEYAREMENNKKVLGHKDYVQATADTSSLANLGILI